MKLVPECLHTVSGAHQFTLEKITMFGEFLFVAAIMAVGDYLLSQTKD
jgi:hypothetical protein